MPAPALANVESAEARLAAGGLFKRFRMRGAYYDAEEDGQLRTEYYRGIDWAAAPATLAVALKERLTETHDGSISYQRAPRVSLSIDRSARGWPAQEHLLGHPFDPVKAIARELARVQRVAEVMGVETSGTGFEALLDRDELWEQAEAEAAAPFNCEHVVCQSWFQKRAPMQADLHHLFACEPDCNTFRGNIPYWQFPPEDEEMAHCGRREGPTKFEPKLGKGAVARATLYFLLRYPGEVGDSPNELSRERLPILLDWHRGFPVTDYERHRNWLIAKAQGNRNPFIDRPPAATAELLAYSFGTGLVV